VLVEPSTFSFSADLKFDKKRDIGRAALQAHLCGPISKVAVHLLILYTFRGPVLKGLEPYLIPCWHLAENGVLIYSRYHQMPNRTARFTLTRCVEHPIEDVTRWLPYPYPKQIRDRAGNVSFDFGPLDAQREAQLRSQPSQRDLIQSFEKAFRPV
jgi:hypothetical protein